MHRGYFDASYNSNGAKAGLIIINSKGNTILEKTVKLADVNNSMEAECEALVQLLKEAVKLGLARLNVFGDCLNLVSMLKSKRINEKYAKYILEIKWLIQYIKKFAIEWIKRKENYIAHKLASKPETEVKKPSLNSMIRQWKKQCRTAY